MATLEDILNDPAMRRRLPAGMRNNNPGNIKYVGQAGTSPSSNLDQGDPQAVYSSPQAGMDAMYRLLNKKYAGGKLTPNDMIAGNNGWTPGNYQAAANVAGYMGIKPTDDIRFSDPSRAQGFMRALMRQEHGNQSSLYPDSMISAAVTGSSTGLPSAAPVGGITMGAPQGAIPSTPGATMPPLARAPDFAADANAATASAAANAPSPTLGDQLGSAIFGDDLAAKLKGQFGSSAAKDSTGNQALALVKGALGGNQNSAQAQADREAATIQPSGLLNDGSDAARAQAASTLMAQLIAKQRGLGQGMRIG